MTIEKLNTIPVARPDGSTLTLPTLGATAILLVNVASECGFTRQYAGLEALYARYRQQGLSVLGVPCNQFGGQEPGSDADIAEFCSKNFGVTFPLAAKTEVNGPGAHPMFRALTDDGAAPVAWNFEKFLVDAEGTLVARFPSGVEPDAPELLAAIDAALA